MIYSDLKRLKEHIENKLVNFSGKVYIVDQFQDTEFTGVDDSYGRYIFLEQVYPPNRPTYVISKSNQGNMSFSKTVIRLVAAMSKCANVENLIQILYNTTSCFPQIKLTPVAIETNAEKVYDLLYDEELKDDSFTLVMMLFEVSKPLSATHCYDLEICNQKCC